MIIIISKTGRYNTEVFNKRSALFLDLSFAKGIADKKKPHDMIVTPNK